MSGKTDARHPAQLAAPRPRLMAHERHSRILAHLATAGSLQVAALAADLGVSEMTVRRDLVELEHEGRLARIHGGAVPALSQQAVAMDRDEPSFAARLSRGSAAKRAIAAVAAQMLTDCRTIALDVGTTTFHLARHLSGFQHASIFTNSLPIADLLGDARPEVYVAGGRIRPHERSIGGRSAVAQFGELWFEAAVIGVSGVTTEGYFDYSLEDADMKRVYFRRSGRRIVLCDAGKFRRMSLVKVGALGDATTLVTDAEPPPDIRAALEAARVDLHIAPPLAD